MMKAKWTGAACAALMATAALAEGPGTYFVPAQGTDNRTAKTEARAGAEKRTVAFLGGSITEMDGFRPRVMRLLRAKYPDVDFTEIASGLSSTCSDVGAFRFGEDILARGVPDLLVVDAAVNDEQDGRFDRTRMIRGMEGIVRRARLANPRMAVVVALFVNQGQYGQLMNGKTPLAYAVHAEVAKHYGAAVADVGSALAASAKAGGFAWAGYRDCHPTPEGCDFAAQVVMKAVEGAFDPHRPGEARALPPAMDPLSYAGADNVPFEKVSRGAGWQASRPDWAHVPGGKRARFLKGDSLWTETDGAQFELAFRGTALAAILTAGPDAGDIEVSTDGGAWRRTSLFTRYSKGLHYPYAVMLADGLADGPHAVRVRAVAAERDGTRMSAVRIHRLVACSGWRERLPRPVYDANPDYAALYYRAWDLAHDRIDELPGLPAPRYMDEAHMSNRIWIWDTCFMVHFCKYLPDEFPGIESLENFYGVMLADGNVPLPKVKGNVWCGADRGKMLDFRIHHPDNPPLFAWTEYVYALQTGDRARLEKVYCEKRWLQRWYDLFDAFDPAAPQPYGSVVKVALKKSADGYHWGGCPSGMDNTARGRKGPKDAGDPGACPEDPDLLWVDAFAQQGLSALYLSRIAELLGRDGEAKEWRAKYEAAKAKINALYWNEKAGFYYDIRESDRSQSDVEAISGFWPMMAEMPTREMAGRMAALVRDDSVFGGAVPTPSLSRRDGDFHADGTYWRGSIWLPTAYMTLKALDVYGENGTAREAGRRLVDDMYRTYREFEPHTIWECYSPTEPKPATDKRKRYVRYDFCGWSALGPISVLIEDVIGVKSANAFTNTLVCDFERSPKGRVGVEDYRFGKVVCTIVATDRTITVRSNLPFTLQADGRTLSVAAGDNVFARN